MTIGLGITLLAGILPAISASRVTPMEALRPTLGKVSIRRMAGWGFWSGVVMLTVALSLLLSQDINTLSFGGLLFIVGLALVTPALITPIANIFSSILAAVYARGGTAQLAEGNLSRQPSRAATTASTTLIALAIVVMAASLVSSLQIGFTQILNKSLGADFIFLPPSVATWGLNVGATQTLRDEFAAVEGVDAITTFRFAPVLMDETVVELMGIDPVTFPQVSGLFFAAGNEATAYNQLGEGRALIINGVMASLVGSEIGDPIDLLTPSGLQTYTVVGIATDFLSAKIPTATISQANLDTDFGVTQDMMFLVNMRPGADRNAAEASFKEILSAYPQFHLVDGKADRDRALPRYPLADRNGEHVGHRCHRAHARDRHAARHRCNPRTGAHRHPG
jgi:putative ABC transport system permease protein